jgi:hypothetical protein
VAKRIKELEIEAEYTEYAVEYSINGEDGFLISCDDEEEARQYRAALDGRIVMRSVFETSWADAPND